MKKVLFIIFFVIILLLDFAALDDITTGNEPDFIVEYLTLILSIPLLALLGYFGLKKKNKNSR